MIRKRGWLLLAVLSLLAGSAVYVLIWGNRSAHSDAGALDGELIIAVRSPGGGKESLRVEEPGALPVRAGGLMYLEVHFNQPALAYLVWLDCEGRVVPLYPWNYDRIEVTDIAEPPPVRRPARVVFNPTIGTGWKFGKRGGLETVLLLARRTPLGEDANLGTLLGSLPPARMRLREEVAILGLKGDSEPVSTLLAQQRGPVEEAEIVDQPLRALLERVRPDFELIRAVRFAHEGE